LDQEVEDASREYLLNYYRVVGDYAQVIADNALRSTSQLRDLVSACEDAGFTELYFDPTAAQLDQIDRLADAVL
jgi:hypothetical protein